MKTLAAIYNGFKSLDYSEIENEIFALLVPLNREAVFQEVRRLGISRHLPTKTAAIRAAVNLVLERKGSFDRCSFRS
jgi:hypothetical protein